MIYYLDVTVTQSGLAWADAIPIPTSMSRAEYDALASRIVLEGDGYTIDLSEGTSTGFAYEDIVGRTVNQIRGLFPDENGDYDHTYARVRTQGAGDFVLLGSSAGEQMIGGDGDDTLYDGGNAGFYYELDGLAGGAGDDTYYLQGVDSSVSEAAGQGYDRVFVEGFFYLAPNSEVEFIKVGGDYAQVYGNNLANTIVGSDQAGIIAGGGGNDVLRSDGGDTVFEGGTGDDAMRGGEGVDAFLYYGAEAGRDVISRFGDEDVLVTTTRIADANGDGIIAFGSNRRIDFASNSSVRLTDEAGATIRSLEYDGAFTSFAGVTYYVYSRTGSAAGVESVSGNELITYYQ